MLCKYTQYTHILCKQKRVLDAINRDKSFDSIISLLHTFYYNFSKVIYFFLIYYYYYYYYYYLKEVLKVEYYSTLFLIINCE